MTTFSFLESCLELAALERTIEGPKRLSVDDLGIEPKTSSILDNANDALYQLS